MIGKWNYLVFKRCLDVSLSLLILIGLLSWLLPLLALLIKLDSRGPIFFLQKRTGKGGRLFTCFKLRTMLVNPQADEAPAMEGDPRITRIGKFLRKTHLDELPQLLNVLSGSMSLVGPRPYMIADEQRFSSMVPDSDLRSFRGNVKPGLTGLAQIRGLHGVSGDPQTVYRRYQWDAFYVRNACLFLDLRVLRLTLLQFFTKKIAYEGGIHSKGYPVRS